MNRLAFSGFLFSSICFFFCFPAPVHAADKVLVVYNSRNGLNVTALHAQEGLRIGIQSLEAEYGPLGIEFVKVDIDDNVAIAANQIKSAIELNKPAAILGAIRSDHALVISDFAESRRIPFITPLATNPKVTEGKSFTFQTCFDDRRQAKHLATYIVKEKQRKRIAVLFNRSHAFSIGFADETKRAIGQEFEGSSAKVVLARGFGALEEIDDQVINELRVQEVDAVVIPSYQVEAANLLSRLSSSLGDKVLYFGPDSWGGGKIFHAAFRNDLGAGPRAFYVEHWAKESSDIKTKKFLKDYSRFQPKNPSLRADTTSDLGPVVAFYELVQFFYSVWRTPPGRELSLKIREARFQGPRGAVSYRSGNAPEKAIHLFAIGRGVEKYLGPYGSAGDSK